MREIKFRAFDENAKVMRDVLSMWHNNDLSVAHIVIVINKEYPIEVDTLFNGFELMQFTGLKDKNGKEIYEGDIVEYGTHHRHTCEVSWNEQLTGFYPLISQNSGDIEIIGNIHQTPELL